MARVVICQCMSTRPIRKTSDDACPQYHKSNCTLSGEFEKESKRKENENERETGSNAGADPRRERGGFDRHSESLLGNDWHVYVMAVILFMEQINYGKWGQQW